MNKLDIDDIIEEPTEPVEVIWVSVICALIPLGGGGMSMFLGDSNGGIFVAIGIALLTLNFGYYYGISSYKEYLRKRKLWNKLQRSVKG